MVQKTFLLFFVLIFLLTSSIVSYAFWYRVDKLQKEYYRGIDTAIDQLQTGVENKLSSIYDSAVGLHSANWYFYWRNPYVDKSSFHHLRRREISAELKTAMTPMEIVHDIVIATPSMDSAISRLGWYTLEEYTDFYGWISFQEDEMGDIQPVILNSQYALMSVSDTMQRESSGTIYLLVDKRVFAQYLSRMMGAQLDYVSIELDGQSIYQAGDHSASCQTVRQIAKGGQTTITFRYPSYSDVNFNGDLVNGLLWLVFSLFVSTALAAFLTHITTKPLRQLLTKFSGASSSSLKDAYAHINAHLDVVRSDNDQLRQENQQLTHSIHRFYNTLENEILFGMLTNPNFDFDGEYVLATMPGVAKRQPFALVFLSPRASACSLPPLEESKALCDDLKVLRLFNQEICVIAWFAAGEEDLYQNLREHLIKRYEKDYFILFSPKMQQIERISASYLSMRNDLERMKRDNNSLPISMQIELLTKIFDGKTEDVLAIASEAGQSYEASTFLRPLEQILFEYNLDDQGLCRQIRQLGALGQEEKAWEHTLGLLQMIISGIGTTKINRFSQITTLVQQFIDENYTNPEISIKLLASHFQMGASLISRVFKAEIGTSFSDYLLTLRMEQALTLLANTDNSIMDIAEMVGYVNYLTFKRAFGRYKGMTPREFRISLGMFSE